MRGDGRWQFVAAGLFSVACNSPVAPHREAAPSAPPVKILAFYPRDTVVTEGGTTVLCYGVSNAKSVRIDPPVGDVWPSFSRCVDVRPKRETTYKLTAEGADGPVSQSVTIHVGADMAMLPKITSFQVVSSKKDYSGSMVFTLSFATQNAEEISIDPPVFPTLHRSPSGQFSVKPDKVTTYTLSVKGKSGHLAQQRLTIEVPAGK